MRLTISRGAALSAAFAACAARTFLCLAVDAPATHNGAWISAILSALLILPLLIAFETLSAERAWAGGYVLYAALLAVTLYDSALSIATVARSAGFLTLNRTPAAALVLPASLAAYWCVRCNGEAIGHGATVWRRLFPALLALIVVLQARHYRPQWLSPILGSGWRGIATGGARAAGGIVPAAGILIVSDGVARRRASRHGLTLLGAMGIAAALLALRSMMVPTNVATDSWISRLDSLLTNGRAPLYLQLPMIALWYAALLHLLACECFAAAALLQRLFPRLDGKFCAMITILASSLFSQAPLLREAPPAIVYPWLYILATLACACAIGVQAAATFTVKGGTDGCVR